MIFLVKHAPEECKAHITSEPMGGVSGLVPRRFHKHTVESQDHSDATVTQCTWCPRRPSQQLLLTCASEQSRFKTDGNKGSRLLCGGNLVSIVRSGLQWCIQRQRQAGHVLFWHCGHPDSSFSRRSDLKEHCPDRTCANNASPQPMD